MSRLIRLSEATALGLHAMAQVARSSGETVSSESLADALSASRAHLSKVLKTLCAAGLLTSKRGPNGGYALARPASSISLLAIYEALQGPIRLDGCLFDEPICDGAHCVLGDLVERVRGEVFEYLDATTLEDVASD